MGRAFECQGGGPPPPESGIRATFEHSHNYRQHLGLRATGVRNRAQRRPQMVSVASRFEADARHDVDARPRRR